MYILIIILVLFSALTFVYYRMVAPKLYAKYEIDIKVVTFKKFVVDQIGILIVAVLPAIIIAILVNYFL